MGTPGLKRLKRQEWTFLSLKFPLPSSLLFICKVIYANVTSGITDYSVPSWSLEEMLDFTVNLVIGLWAATIQLGEDPVWPATCLKASSVLLLDYGAFIINMFAIISNIFEYINALYLLHMFYILQFLKVFKNGNRK